MNYENIRLRIIGLLKKRKQSINEMSGAIGITPQGLKQSFDKKKVRLDVLVSISEYLEVDLFDILLDDEKKITSTNLNMVQEPQPPYGTKKYLEQRVNELEKQVKLILQKID